MGTIRSTTIAFVLTFAGFGLAGCDMDIAGTPVIDSGAAQVVYHQQARDQAASLLVNTMNKHFSRSNGKQFVLENDGVNVFIAKSNLATFSDDDFASTFSELDFDPSVVALMLNTTGFSGMQTAKAPNYTAVWTYNGNTGLDLTITVNSGI